MKTAQEILAAARAHGKAAGDSLRLHKPTDTPREHAAIEHIADIATNMTSAAYAEGYCQALEDLKK